MQEFESSNCSELSVKKEVDSSEETTKDDEITDSSEILKNDEFAIYNKEKQTIYFYVGVVMVILSLLYLCVNTYIIVLTTQNNIAYYAEYDYSISEVWPLVFATAISDFILPIIISLGLCSCSFAVNKILKNGK